MNDAVTVERCMAADSDGLWLITDGAGLLLLDPLLRSVRIRTRDADLLRPVPVSRWHWEWSEARGLPLLAIPMPRLGIPWEAVVDDPWAPGEGIQTAPLTGVYRVSLPEPVGVRVEDVPLDGEVWSDNDPDLTVMTGPAGRSLIADHYCGTIALYGATGRLRSVSAYADGRPRLTEDGVWRYRALPDTGPTGTPLARRMRVSEVRRVWLG